MRFTGTSTTGSEGGGDTEESDAVSDYDLLGTNIG